MAGMNTSPRTNHVKYGEQRPVTALHGNRPVDQLHWMCTPLYTLEDIWALHIYIQSELVYPNSLVPIKICSDYETCGLLNYCKYKRIEEVTRRCVRIARDTD